MESGLNLVSVRYSWSICLMDSEEIAGRVGNTYLVEVAFNRDIAGYLWEILR